MKNDRQSETKRVSAIKDRKLFLQIMMIASASLAIEVYVVVRYIKCLIWQVAQ